MADTMSIDKNDNIKHDSDDSLDSGGEGDMPLNGGGLDSSMGNAQDQPIKRKGGRKPVRSSPDSL